MRKLIFAMVMIVLASYTVYPQNTTRFYVSKGTQMYRDTTDFSSGITLNTETPVDVIHYNPNRKGYFKTLDKYYYVHSYYLTSTTPESSRPQTTATSSNRGSILSNPQTTEAAPDGAAGVKYGMSPSEVKAIWRTRGTLYQDYELTQPKLGSIFFTKIKVGSVTFDIGGAKFVNDKLYEIALSKLPNEDAFAQTIYDELKDILMSNHQNGQSIRRFESPYEDGDGYEMQAVRVGKGTIATYWIFEDSVISLEIYPSTNGVSVRLQYQSDLVKEAKNILNAVNKNEF